MKSKRLSIESFLVIILMILLAISITVMIIQGSKSFDRMNQSKTQNENARIAMSYVNMMIKQHDVHGSIQLLSDFNTEGNTLAIYHDKDEAGLATYIYFKDGTLYEQYSDATDVLDESASLAIVSLDDIQFERTDNGNFKVNYTFAGKAVTQTIALRTGE